MYESPAYWEINGTAIRVLNIFYLKRRFKTINVKKKEKVTIIENDGQIVFTYNEVKKYGISEATFRNAIDKLIEVGFIYINVFGVYPIRLPHVTLFKPPSTYRELKNIK